MGAYAQAFERALLDPEGFWGQAATAIDWYRQADRVLDDDESPFTRWFVGGELNTCPAAKPPNTTECTAPIRAHASIPTTASGIIGM